MAPATDTQPSGRTVRTAGRAAGQPRQKRGEGQWALGYREPLNPNERSKKDDNPLNVRARIENIYAHGGFDSIDPADLRGRFRWRSEEHTSELQSRLHLVCRLLLEKKKKK